MIKLVISLLLLITVQLIEAQDYMPSSTGEVIRHSQYTLSYSEKHEQANWVYYKLTSNHVNGKVKRTDDFRPDSAVSTTSAQLSDYRDSGYDRGHLCPAADMKISKSAMSQTFLLSNISPQNRAFNAGIWNQLEESVRQLAVKYDEVYVVTGPVFKDCIKTIGANRVTVPGYFYKVIYIPQNKPIMIGMLVANKAANKQLSSLAVPVDSIETLTCINFFPQLPKAQQALLEAGIPKNIASLIDASASKYMASNSLQSNKMHQGKGPQTQCRGIAKSTGKRCKSMTSYANGYCQAHQGQAHQNGVN
jgi:endonuclease G